MAITKHGGYPAIRCKSGASLQAGGHPLPLTSGIFEDLDSLTIERMVSFLLGFFAGVLANQAFVLLARYRANRNARRLVGTWIAYKMKGRNVDETPMLGAGPADVSLNRRWWQADSAVLDVRCHDITDESTGRKRDQDGHILIDPSIPWLATRIVRYLDSYEISKQTLVIGPDFNIVHIFPVRDVGTFRNGYDPHVWRRKS